MSFRLFKKNAIPKDCLVANRQSRRSKGVTIFGILLILSSLIHMHKLAVEAQWYANTYSYLPHHLMVARYYFSWLQRIIGLLVGIGLLAQKEIARKIGIAIGCFTILTIYWKHPYPAFKLHTQYLDQQFGYILAQSGIRATFSSVALPAVIIHCIGDIIFWGIFIYFFTRSSVKNQFKPNV